MRPQGNGVGRRSGFSLVELLTVIFIIALLIGILIPSLNAARNAAKKTTTKSVLKSLETGLGLFKNDNESDFPQTNGYPPSFAHPPLTSFGDYQFDAYKGQFPFLSTKPPVYGAQWLPAMLMGLDNQGYIKRSAVPKKNPPIEPPLWYTPQATGDKPIPRANLYISTEGAPTKRTKDLPGRPPEDMNVFFPAYGEVGNLLVFTDAWEQPILYYVASASGKATNMVAKERTQDNVYAGSSDQEKGTPFYFHQDNAPFTGTKDHTGWDFSTTGGKHAISNDGAELTANELIEPDNKETFAHYIVDRKVYSHLETTAEQAGGNIDTKTPLRPVNAESFLLISPGVDGKYGTTDDVSNIPQFESR